MEKPSDQNNPGMDVTYEWGRQAPEQISREASSLDGKIIGIFASASIIISLIVAKGSGFKPDLTLLPLGIAFLSYLVIFGVSIWALIGREFSIADSPIVLQNRYWPREPQAAKLKYWEYVIKYYKINKDAMHIKSTAIKVIVPSLGVEVIFLLAWLFLSFISPIFVVR